MAVTIATVEGRCYRALGLTDTGTAFGSISATATQYNTSDINKAVLAADKLVKLGMLLTPGHYHRSASGVIVATSVTHASILPAHIGPVFAVTFTITGGTMAGVWPGVEASLERINWDNLNPNLGNLLQPKYAIIDEKIYLNTAGITLGDATSVAVTADLALFSPSSSVCQSPDEAEDAVFHGAMRSLQMLDGQNANEAGRWDALFIKDIGLLGINPAVLPEAERMAA